MRVHPWNLVFFTGFVIYVAIRGVFKSRCKGIQTTFSRYDGLEKALVALVVPGGLLLPMIYLFTPWLRFADYRMPGFLPWCGTALMALALWLFWRAHADLGKNWSSTLQLRKDHELITHGVYRRIRHPMYASIWLFSLAQGLLLANWLAGWYAFAAFAVMYFVRTPREEQMMRESFGQAYCDYAARTGRLLPRCKSEPASSA